MSRSDFSRILPPPCPVVRVRYGIVSRYIHNQTDEAWEAMLEEIRVLEDLEDVEGALGQAGGHT